MRIQNARVGGIEFVGLPAPLTDARRAALRKRYGHRADPFNKRPATLYLPRKVHTALMRKLKEVDRDGGYTCGYEFLVDAGELAISKSIRKGRGRNQ